LANLAKSKQIWQYCANLAVQFDAECCWNWIANFLPRPATFHLAKTLVKSARIQICLYKYLKQLNRNTIFFPYFLFFLFLVLFRGQKDIKKIEFFLNQFKLKFVWISRHYKIILWKRYAIILWNNINIDRFNTILNFT
jgi:hypothetical protein